MFPRLISVACLRCALLSCGGVRNSNHLYAIYRARRYAQLAARAFVGNDRVHHFCRARDGIHRTGLYTQGAADAPRFIDDGDRRRFGDATASVEWNGCTME